MTDPRLRDLRETCAAAGLDLPDDDLPALHRALARHRDALELLRAAVSADHEPTQFDPAWP